MPPNPRYLIGAMFDKGGMPPGDRLNPLYSIVRGLSYRHEASPSPPF